jgi:ribosomal protein L11 methylase PrmA
LSSAARLRVTFHLSDAASEWAGSALSDLFPDGLLLATQPGGVTRLQGWLKGSGARASRTALKRLALLGATRVSLRLQRSQGPAAAAHGRFPALRLGPFLVLSSGSPAVSKARRTERNWPIILVQGQAFGSGRHESTRLMLEGIEALKPEGLTVLDVGAGSGILGFACLALGAARVVSVEAESAACHELRRNRVLNGVDARRMPVICGSFPLKRLGAVRYPLVLANLVTPVLLALMPGLAARTARGGALLCGGIHTEPESRAVTAAAGARGLALDRSRRLRQWNVLRFIRP